MLTHWGQVMHLYISKLTIISSDNGLSPGRCQTIIWTNAGILLIIPLQTNFNEILIEIHKFSFKKIPFKMPSGKWRPFRLGLHVLNRPQTYTVICHTELSLSTRLGHIPSVYYADVSFNHVKNLTRPKYNFTHPRMRDGWLGRTLWGLHFRW